VFVFTYDTLIRTLKHTFSSLRSIRILSANPVDSGTGATKDFSVEDKGELLKSGAIYGFEQVVLPSHVGLKNVVVSYKRV
jgi:hypothetical protein